jgi:hypothetical protein
MDLFDACWEVATAFSKHADSLDNFLYKYEPVLPADILKMVEKAAIVANEGSFEVFMDDSDNPDVTEKGVEMAENLYEIVRDASLALQKIVELQVDKRAQ